MTRYGLVAALGGWMVLVAGGPLAAQELPRTAWGDPDLMGTWSYASLTPLQRPTLMAEKEFFTPEEAAQRNFAVTQDQPDSPGSVGSYNALWFDRGEVAEDLRTALIVDPPNGRLPPRTEPAPRAEARGVAKGPGAVGGGMGGGRIEPGALEGELSALPCAGGLVGGAGK